MSSSPVTICLTSRHRPGPIIAEVAGIRRARCRSCGLKLMRMATGRRWIIADELGA